MDKLFTEKEVAEYFGVAKSTFWLGVKKGKFPRPVRIMDRVTRWRQSDIQAFTAALDPDDYKPKGSRKSNHEKALDFCASVENR